MTPKKTARKMSKPSTKASKPAITRDRSSKESPWIEDYLDCFSFKIKPVTEAFLERIGQELITWAETEKKEYKISPFFEKKRIGWNTYTNWAKKYPKFRAAYDLAKSILGTRREYGAIERKFDASTIIQMMPTYDPEWRQMVKERNEMKAQANEKNSGGTQFVVMEKFSLPDSGAPQVGIKQEQVSTKSPEEVAGEVTIKGIEQKRLSK